MSTLSTTILKHPDSISNNLKFDSNGNVSIGNPTPASSAGFNTLTIGNGTTTGGQIHIENSSGDNFQIWHTPTEVNYFSSLDQVFYTGGTESMRLDSGGQLNLNTTTNASLLSIYPLGTPTELGKWADCAIGIGNSTILGHYSQMGLGYFNVGTYAPGNFGFVSTSQAGFGKGDLVFGTRDVSTDTQPTERVRITSGGLVGIGTLADISTGGDLHVNSQGARQEFITFENRQNYGWGIGLKFTMPMESGGSSVVNGQIYSGWKDVNEGFLAFSTFNNVADAAGSTVEKARICEQGFFHSDPTGTYYGDDFPLGFHSFGTNLGQWTATLTNSKTTGDAYGLLIRFPNVTPNGVGSQFIYMNDDTALRAEFRSNGGLANYQANNANLCDEREKKNIVSLDTKWDKVKSWELKKFHYNEDADTDDLRYGVIAQQVEAVCPEVLTEWTKQRVEEAVLDEDGNVVTPAKEEIIRKGVKEQQMMWMAIKALQEAQDRIEQLEAKVATLEAG